MHEIVVLLVLLAAYAVLGAVVWLIFCSGSTAAVRKLNAAVSAREGSVFSVQAAVKRKESGDTRCVAPDLDATLTALVLEKRLPENLARRLRRIHPVFHEGKWVVYPSNAYWSHRFERFRSR